MGSPYIQMRSGRYYHYGSDANFVSVKDIADHLSKINRFAGATSEFYSVAQHSVFVSELVEDDGGDAETIKRALFHDAHEALMSDLPTPFHRYVVSKMKTFVLERYGEITDFDAIKITKDEMDRDIFRSIGLSAATPLDQKQAIKRADNIALVTEAAQLVNSSAHWLREVGVEASTRVLIPLSPEAAKHDFLRRYREIESKNYEAA